MSLHCWAVLPPVYLMSCEMPSHLSYGRKCLLNLLNPNCIMVPRGIYYESITYDHGLISRDYLFTMASFLSGSVPSLAMGLASGALMGFGAYQTSSNPQNVFVSMGLYIL